MVRSGSPSAGVMRSLILRKLLPLSYRFHTKGEYSLVGKNPDEGTVYEDAARLRGRGYPRTPRRSGELPGREPDSPTRSSRSAVRPTTSPPEDSSTARIRGRKKPGVSSAATSPMRSGTTGPTTASKTLSSPITGPGVWLLRGASVSCSFHRPDAVRATTEAAFVEARRRSG